MAKFNADAIASAGEVLTDDARGAQAIPFAISLLNAVYGPNSPQLEAYNVRLAEGATHGGNAVHTQRFYAHAVIQNVIREIQNGLIVNLRAQVAGEVLAELVRIGKEILQEGTESAKNVSAVLVAAAFEDLLRRMGSELAGITGRPDLQDVIIALKKAGILTGGEPGLAQSYLKFRNDSLHADWANVQQSQVQSCLSFTENLLLKHFS